MKLLSSAFLLLTFVPNSQQVTYKHGIRADMSTYVRTHVLLHTCVLACIHAYICTNTCIRYMHGYVHTCKHRGSCLLYPSLRMWCLMPLACYTTLTELYEDRTKQNCRWSHGGINSCEAAYPKPSLSVACDYTSHHTERFRSKLINEITSISDVSVKYLLIFFNEQLLQRIC